MKGHVQTTGFTPGTSPGKRTGSHFLTFRENKPQAISLLVQINKTEQDLMHPDPRETGRQLSSQAPRDKATGWARVQAGGQRGGGGLSAHGTLHRPVP